MSQNLFKVLLILVLVVSISFPSIDVVQAADLVPVGPHDATAPADDWVELIPGQEIWYVFYYDADLDADTPSEAVVELEMGAEDSVSFEVWTPEQVRKWATEVDFDPIGTGAVKSDFTLNEDHDTKLIWANRTRASETFYVIVENNRDIASYFSLDIDGDDVSFPTMAAPASSEMIAETDVGAEEEVLTESLAIEVEGATTEIPAISAGNGPDSVLTPSGEWIGIEPGQEIWYAFHYDYDQHASSISEALVELEMGTEDSVSFEVWTPEQVHKWAMDDEFDPIGAGAVKSDFTLNEDHDTKLIWANRTPVSETFYVIVENRRDTTSYYALNISGEDVSFPEMATSDVPMVAPEDGSDDEVLTSSDDEVLTESLGVEVDGTLPKSSAGYGPETAAMPSPDAVVIAPGEMHWYTFRAQVDPHEPNAEKAEVMIALNAISGGEATFEVWSDEDLRLWRDIIEFTPTGAGTENEDVLGEPDGYWAAAFDHSITFYVVVMNDASESGIYTLDISATRDGALSFPSPLTISQ